MVGLTGGAASVDFTPSKSILLSGFAARTEPSLGVRDALTARAIVLGDTAIVVADVIGVHEDMSARIRARCSLPDANIIVAATHTHGAPNSVAGRIGGADPEFLAALEDACVEALERALTSAKPVQLSFGWGTAPDVARNRRHEGGIVDRAVPVIRMRGEDGALVATLFSYALHPTVLGADNRLITAEYPHYARLALEQDAPGSVAIFLNGCTGDVNIGHAAHASLSLAASNARSFANAERIGGLIADAVAAAPEAPLPATAVASDALVELALERRERDLLALAAAWELEAQTADPVRYHLLKVWADWARTNVDVAPGTWSGRVSLLVWGGVPIAAMPGEIFAETGLSIRAAVKNGPAMVISYADGAPGYIPPASEYRHGGYEVDEAHRYMGLPGAFATGSAEKLAEGIKCLLERENFSRE